MCSSDLPCEAKSLAKPFGLVLSRIVGGVRDAFSRRGPSPTVFPWRGSPGLESLVLAKTSEESCGPWQAGPWYPGFHCADSSPRARDGHAEAHGWRRSVEGPTVPAGAATRGAQRLRPRPRPPRLQRATWRGPPRLGSRSIKPGRADCALHFSHNSAALFLQTAPSSQSTPAPGSSSSSPATNGAQESKH